VEIVPFEAKHLRYLSLQSAQSYASSELSKPEYGQQLEQMGDSFTGIHNGQVIGCAGIWRIWENRAHIWALLSPDAGRHFVAIHRAVVAKLATLEDRRIEAAVDVGFVEAHRWIEMLGFTYEGTMKAYTPDGRDSDLYARIR
jgi:RimJ/RimL family protein N-acetyltransferase